MFGEKRQRSSHRADEITGTGKGKRLIGLMHIKIVSDVQWCTMFSGKLT